MVRAGIELKSANPNLPVVDLLARLEVKLKLEGKAKHARGLLQVYKVIHVSNGISEITGHIVNEMVKGPRLRMGVMMMENLLRLHNLPPLESLEADKWIERLVHY